MKHLIFMVFVLLTIWAYMPSLQHAPKHDQLAFQGDIALRDSAWDRTAGAYSWNRDRLFMGSDQFLFRPLLHLFLAAQLFVFGYNASLWQGMGITLHLAVGFSMYRLLTVIRPGVSAAFVSGFFLLMLCNLPMVVWHNISAYLVFWSLILAVITCLFKAERNGSDKALLWVAAFLLLMASFIFEAGIIFCLCCSLFAALFIRPRRLALIFLLPVVVYFILNLADFVYRNALMTPEGGRIAGQIFSLKTLWNGVIALKWFLTTGLFLRSSEIIPIERVVISYITLDPRWPFIEVTPHLWRGLAAILVFGGLAWSSLRTISDKRREIILLILTMIIGLILFICFGRVNTRGIVTGLFFNSYYVYFFWVLILPAAYAVISFDKIKQRADGGLIRFAVYFLCGAFIFINILSIHNVNLMIAKVDKPRRIFIEAVAGFVDKHRNEKDLSFFIPHTCSGNYAGKWLSKNTDPKWRRYTLAEVLYPQYYSAVNPKYRLSCNFEEWQ